MSCNKCETTDNIVHSGVDALLLGIDGAATGNICYDCANAARNGKEEVTE